MCLEQRVILLEEQNRKLIAQLKSLRDLYMSKRLGA